MSKRIFISKNTSEIEPYRSQFEEIGYTVLNHSFLSFSPIEFDVERDYDVLLFGSVRSVIFFKACESIPENKAIGCVGGKTAELLETLGHTVDFVGAKSGEPKRVAEEFKSWLGAKRVLFPISDRSLKTISSVIDENQKEEVVVYSTEVKDSVVDECDVYVLTSPSNVEGFFIENDIPKGSEVIAWGKSTESALIEKGIRVTKVLSDSSFTMLIDSLQSS
ncbi:MAG: uroporphyrinogen-III synthase [Crocinitomicaceae bacterium]|nr:uroporphyrinogen-III synthase [Crocinitomicaceae bacterium]